MPTINEPNFNKDLTVRVFDNFYNYDVSVPSAEYDIVVSYFRTQMKTRQAAENFTVSLFQIAEETGIPALDLLKAFEGNRGVSIDLNLAYYLNSIRNRATLLGVGVAVVPNFYAARAVIQ
jgi:hypothetical protein